jgi:hypothetical protein
MASTSVPLAMAMAPPSLGMKASTGPGACTNHSIAPVAGSSAVRPPAASTTSTRGPTARHARRLTPRAAPSWRSHRGRRVGPPEVRVVWASGVAAATSDERTRSMVLGVMGATLGPRTPAGQAGPPLYPARRHACERIHVA